MPWTTDAGSPASDAELVPSSRARAWLALGIAGVRAFALCLIVVAVRLNEVAGGRTYSEVSDAISPSRHEQVVVSTPTGGSRSTLVPSGMNRMRRDNLQESGNTDAQTTGIAAVPR